MRMRDQNNAFYQYWIRNIFFLCAVRYFCLLFFDFVIPRFLFVIFCHANFEVSIFRQKYVKKKRGLAGGYEF